MNTEKVKAGQLEEWILMEAYKNGLARLNKESATADFGPEKLGGYFVHRHNIYQGYFKLPNDPLTCKREAGGSRGSYHDLRLRSTVILCESVKQLLKNRLIHFPRGGTSKENRADLLQLYASFIFLTEAGVQKAEALLSALKGTESQGQLEGSCAA